MSRILTVTLNPALDLSTETGTIVPQRKLRCAVPRLDPGGGGINVTRALQHLGGDSRCLLALGGETGQTMRRLLKEEGIAIEIFEGDYPTRQSFSVREETTGVQYRFVMPGAHWTDADCARAQERILSECEAGDLIVPSGSLPPGVPAGFFAAMNEAIMHRGGRMVLDTSGDALADAANRRAGLFCLRMDHVEAETLAGRKLNSLAATAEFASELHESGSARLVAIACGADGTILVDGVERWHCAPPEVEVVSAVGAGDSFVAGFVLGLQRMHSPVEACALGVASAASAVTTPDTQLCDGARAHAFVDQVVISMV